MYEDSKYKKIDTRSLEYIEAEIACFDEDEDVILPNSIFGEIVYIFYILRYMYKNKDKRAKQWFLLKRQIRMFKLWRKRNYGKDYM